jgi:hypothetical protein
MCNRRDQYEDDLLMFGVSLGAFLVVGVITLIWKMMIGN